MWVDAEEQYIIELNNIYICATNSDYVIMLFQSNLSAYADL